MKTALRAARDDSGAAAVELALALTVFMLLVLGGLNYGLYLWTANALQQTAVQTARCMGVLESNCAASRAYSASNATSFAQSIASGYGVTLTSGNLSLNPATSCGGQGSDNSNVSISYTFSGISPRLLPGISSTAMNASACFPNQS